MAKIGYARVSSEGQDHSNQIEKLKAAGCTKIFSEKKSGTKREGREALKQCLEYVREGDTLCVMKLDRFARSARDLHNMVHELNAKGVHFNVLDQSIDTSTTHGKAFLGMLVVFAEFEADLIKERQMDGIRRAKAAGNYKGRKATAQAKAEEVMALVEQGVTKSQIASDLGISRQSVYNIIKAA